MTLNNTNTKINSNQNNNYTKNSSPEIIDDFDILESLRNSYNRQHKKQYSTPNMDNNNNNSNIINSSQITNDTLTSVDDNNYFAQFNTNNDFVQNIPTSNSITNASSQNNNSTNNYIDDSALQSIRRERQRIQNRYRRQSFFNSLCNIRWGLIFRILSLVLTIFIIFTIWSMRYVILDYIMTIFISAIPCIMILAAIIYVIKPKRK